VLSSPKGRHPDATVWKLAFSLPLFRQDKENASTDKKEQNSEVANIQQASWPIGMARKISFA
jgi:hypothetical protein